MNIETRLDAALRDCQAQAGFEALLVAVSGGSDSLALLHLSHDWARAAGIPIAAVTVDHGLRAESADEAAKVHEICAGLDVPHQTLRWQGWAGQGNLQQAAREARYDLIATAEIAGGASPLILLGHTKDDLAETFLMRLARGSGVDGLSAMRGHWQARGRHWARPLLDARREELRDWLRGRGIGWIDDPSNENERFDRVKARRALRELEPLGLGVDRLAATAETMSEARRALERVAQAAAKEIARVEAGDVVIDRAGLAGLEVELRDRLMSHALKWVSSSPYRPRRDALHALESDLCDGRHHATLQGCLLTQTKDTLRVAREPEAVRAVTSPVFDLWDNRWQLTGPECPGCEIRALGEAITSCPDWRETGLPRESLRASPSVWKGDTLVAAPLAGLEMGWSVELVPPGGDFVSSILSH